MTATPPRRLLTQELAPQRTGEAQEVGGVGARSRDPVAQPSGRHDGAVGALSLLRWGDVGHPGTFGYEPFGGYASEEKTFSGVTIPTEYRIGWHFGTDRFDEGGLAFDYRLRPGVVATSNALALMRSVGLDV